MSANTPSDMVVQVAPGVERDPEAERAITQATDYLGELIRQHHLGPAKRELMWGTSGQPPFEHVVAHLRESDGYGSFQSDRLFPRRRLLDPVTRDGLMISLLLDVRGKRRAKMGEVIRRGLDELEEGGTNGQPD